MVKLRTKRIIREFKKNDIMCSDYVISVLREGILCLMVKLKENGQQAKWLLYRTIT